MSEIYAEHEDEIDETSPLLENERPRSSTKVSTTEEEPRDIPQYKRVASAIINHLSQWKIVYIAFIFVVIINFAGNIAYPSQLRMLEAAICRRFYAQENPSIMDMVGDIPEEYCMLDPIQAELALVMAWFTSFKSVVGMVSAIPWGVLADKKGRRFVILLGVLGVFLADVWYYIVCYNYNTLPPRALWAGSLTYALGGGETVVTSIILAILADASSPDIRSTVLFLVSAASLACQFVGPTLGIAALKRFSYWIPAAISLATGITSMLPLAFIPTKAIKANRHVAGGHEELDEVEGEHVNDESPAEHSVQTWYQRLASSFVFSLSEVAKVIDLIAGNPTLRLGIVILGFSMTNAAILSLLPQFVSKRFSRSIGDASYVLVAKGATSMIMLLIVLPGITKLYRMRLHISGPPLDLRTIHISGPFLVLGSLCLGLANTPALFFLSLIILDLGIGFRPAIESFLSSAVLPSQMATLFVAISVIDTIGVLLISPLLAWAFSKGMHFGGAWIGMPFFVASIALLVAVILALFMRLRSPADPDAEDERHER